MAERKQRRRGNSRPTPPRVSRYDVPLDEQLGALFDRLKPAHLDLVGIGLGEREKKGVRRGGRRRAGASRPSVPVTTIRLIVRTKFQPERGRKTVTLPKGSKRFAKNYPLYLRVLGQPVRVDVPTDVAQRLETAALGFQVAGARASALAVWNDAEGKVRGGVISCAHLMPKAGGAVGIEAGNPAQPAIRGIMHTRANEKADSADVCLIRVNKDAERLTDAAASEIADAPTAHDVARVLGNSTDLLVAATRYWDGRQSGLRALAYYAKYEFNNQGIGDFTLHNIIELFDPTGDPLGTFVPGRSGSLMAADAVDDFPWLLGTLSQATRDGKIAFAYHFLSGLDWLARQPNVRQLEWCFTADKFRRLLADRRAGA